MRHRLLPFLLILGGCAPAAGLAPTPGAPVTEVIGALIHRDGSAAQMGADIDAGLALAEADFNAYAATKGMAFRLKLQVEDVASDATAAYGRLKAAGSRAIVGPVTSADAAVLMGPATADGLLLLSPSSTAPSLAKDDNLMRFAPVDVLEAVALVRAMGERGVKAEIAIARDDVYGKDLAREVEFAAGMQGIEHVGTVTYSATAGDYGAAVEKAELLAARAEARYGAGAVGVELVSFGEAPEVFKAADSKPKLKAARWFGCDGNARSTEIARDASAADFARQVGFMAPAFVTPSEAGLTADVDARIASPADITARAAARLGHQPGSFVFTAYDALWALGLAREELGALSDTARLKSALYARSQSFKGVAGPATLNPQGDRTTGTYGFFTLSEGADWKLDALYGNTTYTRLD